MGKPSSKKKKFYAVHRGRAPGVYDSWPAAEAQVKGFANARFKGFATRDAAEHFRRTGTDGSQQQKTTTDSRGAAAVPPGLAVYTDGGCVGNANVAQNRTQPAGWAFVAYRNNEVVKEAYGPVELDRTSPRFLGAEVRSNNTGELSAIAEALRWLNRSGEPATLCYDSTYAANITQRIFRAHKNQNLAATCQNLLDQVRRHRSVTFRHVKGHSGDVGNERADHLVSLGCRGRRSEDDEAAAAPKAIKRRSTTLSSSNNDVIDLTADDDDSSSLLLCSVFSPTTAGE